MTLFTYGSLMLPEVMRAVAGATFSSEGATLAGYARYRMRGKTYPGIVPRADSLTRGVIYRGVDPDSLARLDAFEGVCYERVPVTATTSSGLTVACEVYVVAPAHRGMLSSEDWRLEDFRDEVLARFAPRAADDSGESCRVSRED